MDDLNPLPYTAVGFDIEKYGTRDGHRQGELQDRLDRLLSEACRSAGIDRGHWHRQPQGDGEFALVPADVPKPLLVDDFVGHLVRGRGGRRPQRPCQFR